MLDEYEDETGIDTAASTNESYNATDDCYTPTEGWDSYIKLLLHCNGTDGSQTFIDEIGKTVTAIGNAQIDTAQSKFGGASGLFDGAGDYLSIPDSDDWNFGSGDFTIDLWVRFNSVAGTQMLVGQLAEGGIDNSWFLYWTTPEYIKFGYSTDGINITTVTRGWAAVVNTWYHIAVVRNGDNLYFFVDGIQAGTTYNMSGAVIYNSSRILEIGTQNSGVNDPFNGWLDEVRISKGIARWTTNFTPPTSEYSQTVENMTLISQNFTAKTQPSSARIVIFEEDVDTITLNTDLKAYASRDGGTTWDQITLADKGNYASGKRILHGTVDLTSSGTTMKYKITTHNNKNLKLHSTGLLWA
jgi:hypothetical protein